MSDKKIIIVAIIGALALIVGGWLLSKSGTSPEPASIADIALKTPASTLGDGKAPVLIEEYTNLLCPACAQFGLNTLPQIQDEFVKTGKVKMVFYITPPLETAEAAFCASQQQKFMEFHDYFFTHQKEITQASDIPVFAAAAGLDKDKFDACYGTTQAKETAEKWYKQGSERGVKATPTFFINGQMFEGARPYEEFKNIIESKLK